MRRKWKIGLVLAGAAVAFGAAWWWPSQEPIYEGKRLGEWLDEGMRLASELYSTNPSVSRVVKAVQAIGTNAIPFLLRDMERREDPRWLWSVKTRAHKLKLIDETHYWSWRLNRSVWGFQALGTNAAPALERLLAIYDGCGVRVGSAGAALSALGPFAVPELEKRLHATNSMKRGIAAGTLSYLGPVAEPAIPSLLAMLDDTNTDVRRMAVVALSTINRQPERLVPLFRGLLRDSNETVRIYAAIGLGKFGLSAKEAIPDLVRATNDSNMYVIRSARRALEQINP